MAQTTGAEADSAQASPGVRTGWDVSGVPALNYNSDEGFGYGAEVSLFNYGAEGYNPYRFRLDLQIFLTTRGRRQGYLYADVPGLSERGRAVAEVRYQRYGTAPFYGVGNDVAFTRGFVDPDSPRFRSPDYYQFQRTRFTAWANYQHTVGPFRLLGGAGLAFTDVATAPEAPTLLGRRQRQVRGTAGGFTNYLKVGALYDTRDFEPAPTQGDFTDFVAEASHSLLGSDYDYLRTTLTHRHYVTITPGLVFAERVLLERLWGDPPFYELSFTGSAFRPFEGLGGASTIRGVPQNRFVGSTKLFANLEVRWRAVGFELLKQDLYLALSAFLDGGRVWSDDAAPTLQNLHLGTGGGLHVGWDETFIVTVNAGTSAETGAQIYINTGYLF
jgi:hypothetical protein